MNLSKVSKNGHGVMPDNLEERASCEGTAESSLQQQKVRLHVLSQQPPPITTLVVFTISLSLHALRCSSPECLSALFPRASGSSAHHASTKARRESRETQSMYPHDHDPSL